MLLVSEDGVVSEDDAEDGGFRSEEWRMVVSLEFCQEKDSEVRLWVWSIVAEQWWCFSGGWSW